MSVKFEFYLSEEDTDRLFSIKEDYGEDNLSGNDFAKIMLEKEIHRLHPHCVKYDEITGERIK